MIPELIAEIPSLFKEKVKTEILFNLGKDLRPMSFEKVLQLCRSNLNAVSITVDEAEKHFGFPSYDPSVK